MGVWDGTFVAVEEGAESPSRSRVGGSGVQVIKAFTVGVPLIEPEGDGVRRFSREGVGLGI